MDPLIAFTAVVTALLEFMTEVVRGATPEQKEKLWAYYLEDVARWRKVFKLEDPA